MFAIQVILFDLFDSNLLEFCYNTQVVHYCRYLHNCSISKGNCSKPNVLNN